MTKLGEKLFPYAIITLVVYMMVLMIKWTYEDKAIYYLEVDVLAYDIAVAKAYSKNHESKEMYNRIFIKSEDLIVHSWWYNWNIFDWGMSKFIKKDHREYIISNLNFWKKTGMLPTENNLDVRIS